MTKKEANTNKLTFLLFAISIILLVFFVLNTSTIKSQSTNVVIHSASSIVDGDLIKTSTNPDIYIVKINNNLRYKRLILNPDIFDSYGHLEWSNVKTVSQSTLNSFATSQLVREVNDNGKIVNGRVYMLFENGDTGTKRHIQLTQSEFLEAGGTESSIYSINSTEASDTFYSTGSSITTVQQLRSLLTTSSGPTIIIPTTPNPPLVIPQAPIVPPPSIVPTEEDNDDTETSPRPPNGGGDNSSGSGDSDSDNNTTKASLSFTKGTLQPTTIIPGSKQEVLTINVLSSNRPTTVRSMKVALSPTTGTDTSIENTFNQIQLIVDGSVVSTKNIESTQDYEKVLNTAVITLNNLAIDIEEDSTKSIQIHLSTVRESPLKDWNIIINKDSISAIDDDNNTYSNNNPITISTSVRRTNIPTTRPPSTVRNFTASNITTTSLTLSWDEYTNAEDYEVDYCEGSSCTNYSNSELTTGLTRQIDSLTQGTVYKFRIRAVLPNNRYSAYRTILQGTSLNAPTLSVSNSQATLTSISLLWTPVTNADGYVIEQCKRESKTTECTDYTISKTITGNDTTTTAIENLQSSSLYQFRIKSAGNHPKVDSSFSDFSQAYTKFLPPTNLRVTNPTSTTIDLAWNAVPMGEGYTIKQCTTPTSCTELNVPGSETDSKEITSLTPNTAYTFSIRIFNLSGSSDYSSTISSRTTLSAPDNLRKTSSTLTSLTVAWDTVTDADGYILQACEGETCTNFASIYTGALLTYQHTNLTTRETYKFRVRATGATPKVNSDWSDINSYVVSLDSPSNFRATGRTATSITFAWDATTNSTGYTVDYCRGTNCTPNETSTEASASTDTELTISGLDGGITYRARIKASYAGSLESGYSDIINHNTRIGTPVNFRSTSHSVTEINLKWNRVHDSAVAGYTIQYCDGVDCDEFDETINVSGGSTKTATVSSLSASTAYRFRIISTNSTLGSSFDSYPSLIVSQSTSATLSKPTNFTVKSSTTTSITLEWDAVLSASGYLIKYCDGASCSTLDEEETIANGATTSKTISGLTSSTVYRFRIKATHTTSSFDSSYSDLLTTGTKLSTPSNLRSMNPTATRIPVHWDVVSNATGYVLEYCDGASCTEFDTEVIVSGGSTSTTSVTGLAGSTIYNFRIKATGNNSLESDYSSAVNLRTKLKRPSNFSSISRSIASITLAWDEVPNADGYSIVYCDGATCTEFDETETVASGSTTNKIITGLTSNIEYRFKIKATSVHTGIDSYESSVLNKSTTTTLPTPLNLLYGGRFGGGVTLRWSPVNDATGYTIQHCSGLSCTPSTAVDVSGGSTSSTVITLPSGAYGFRIKATHTTSSFDSAYSQTVYSL